MDSKQSTEGFYIAVDNSTTPRSSNFVNHLYSKIKLPPNTFEVAATEIEFALGRLQQLGDKLEDGEVEIQVGNYSEQTLVIPKYSDDYETWQTEANLFVMESESPWVDFLAQNVNGEIYFVINNRDPSRRTLVIDKYLSRALGFNGNDFPRGPTTSIRPVSEYLFEILPSHEGFQFSWITRPTIHEFNIIPAAKVGTIQYSELLNNLRLKITELRLTDYISANHNTTHNTCTISPTSKPTPIDKHFRMKFSKNFNKKFDLPNDFVFTHNITKTFQIPSMYLPLPGFTIYMEGLKPTFINQSLAPVLATVYPKREAYSLQVVRPDPRSYVPLEKNEFDYIRLYIIGSDGQKISFHYDPLKVKLHFRPRRYAQSRV